MTDTYKTALFAALLMLAITGIYAIDGKNADAATSTEAATEATTATLDVFVPAAACAEIVSQDYNHYVEFASFEVLCRDAAGRYAGFRAVLKREVMRKKMTRFVYHFAEQDEMTIAER